MVAQLKELVRIPSQAGLDDYTPVLRAVRAALRAHNIDAKILRSDGGPIGVWGAVRGKKPGPTFMLNATVDTAPFGARDTWARDPLSGHIEKGWLYGRGTADSKSGVVIFCHVLARISHVVDRLRGALVFLFDADEHSGTFGGIRHFVETHPELLPRGGVLIGYPGHDRIVIGCRGFFRAKLTVHGLAAHSGSSTRHGINAINRAAEVVRRIETLKLPADGNGAFGIPPMITVTEVHGGDGFSTVPDQCRLHVDMRLTPAFTTSRAESSLRRLIGKLDASSPAPPTVIETLPGWPAYQLPEEAPVYRALRTAARSVLRRSLPGEVVGPSSVGNYLALLGVDATSGFGVRYRNIHAADECIDTTTLEPTFQTYLEAVNSLLQLGSS